MVTKRKIPPDIYAVSFCSVLNVVQTKVRKVKRNPENPISRFFPQLKTAW